MREINFRGISTYNNDWIKGGYLKTVFKDKTDDHKIYPLLYNVNPHTIKIETLGQFTGLTDKNGTEIYEGDIVKHPLSTEPEHLGFIIEFRKYEYIAINVFDNQETDFNVYFENYEVIGNIHENPELL